MGSATSDAATEAIERRAAVLAAGPVTREAVDALVAAAGGDRGVLEAARNRVALRLHGNAADWAATGTLTLLNKALVQVGWSDPYDWKVRWAGPLGRRKP